MKQIIITYKLKPEVSDEQFENWVKEHDQPTMRGISRVSRFQTFKSNSLLMGEGQPSFDYVEIFDITDLDGFLSEDMGSDIVQKILGEFMNLVDNPQFVIGSEV